MKYKHPLEVGAQATLPLSSPLFRWVRLALVAHLNTGKVQAHHIHLPTPQKNLFLFWGGGCHILQVFKL